MTLPWIVVAWIGFGLSALAYGAIGLLIAVAHPGSKQANWLLAAVAMSVIWAVALLVFLFAENAPSSLLPIADAAYLATWALCLAAMLRGANEGGSRSHVPTIIAFATCALLLAVVVLELSLAGQPSPDRSSVYMALLAIPLVGLFAVEQVYRNSEFRQRRVWLPLSLAVGAIFAINVFVYSQAVLFGELLASIWVLRGVVGASAAPLIMIAIKRQPDWENGLFVSRQVVFYTTSVSAAGLYLITMALGGYLVGTSSLAWGPALQIVFLCFAALVLLYGVFSAAFRARLRVFIAKHFYRNRYDYREEWLRLIQTLAAAHSPSSVAHRGIEALAVIIGSRSGQLWLCDSRSRLFEGRAGWNAPKPDSSLTLEDPIVAFMRRTRWLVDTAEYAEDPEKYANAFAGDLRFTEQAAIYVPLVHEGDLLGIVRLERPPSLGGLGYEDHDLLKTAGQQVAIFLAQERSKEELLQTRQLEAFSKLTTFLMHDLKNLIAQQELVVANAKKHGHRPEFVADAMRTIDASVHRMRKVLARLQGDGGAERISHIDLAALLGEVCGGCADRMPVPRLRKTDCHVTVTMDRERLAMAVTHAIRNAQDATDTNGSIELSLAATPQSAVIEISDTGIGMDADFIQDRLFRPFESTKGAQGMGIGAYQLRETLRAAGGDVEVRSEPGRGTTLSMKLPLEAQPGVAESVA